MLNYNTYRLSVDKKTAIIFVNYNEKISNDLKFELIECIEDGVRDINIFIDMMATNRKFDLQVDQFFRNIIEEVKNHVDEFGLIRLIYDNKQFLDNNEREMIACLLKYLTKGLNSVNVLSSKKENIFRFPYCSFDHDMEKNIPDRQVIVGYVYESKISLDTKKNNDNHNYLVWLNIGIDDKEADVFNINNEKIQLRYPITFNNIDNISLFSSTSSEPKE